jgi:hypothetical protein
MTEPDREPTIGQPLEERPRLRPSKIAKTPPRDLVLRFIAGAATSVVAGVLSIAFGARIGGVMLAFPAILGASLTLIEEQEDSVDAREDARGAVVGGLAMVVFALIAASLFGKIAGALGLAAASAGWVLTALAGYAIAWWR